VSGILRLGLGPPVSVDREGAVESITSYPEPGGRQAASPSRGDEQDVASATVIDTTRGVVAEPFLQSGQHFGRFDDVGIG
jgi:hypothetical protein